MQEEPTATEDAQKLSELRAEYEARLARLNRVRSAQNLWWVMVLLLGIAVGFAIAEWIIDPVTVVVPCEGIEV